VKHDQRLSRRSADRTIIAAKHGHNHGYCLLLRLRTYRRVVRRTNTCPYNINFLSMAPVIVNADVGVNKFQPAFRLMCIVDGVGVTCVWSGQCVWRAGGIIQVRALFDPVWYLTGGVSGVTEFAFTGS
jgi:hypothetical protein